MILKPDRGNLVRYMIMATTYGGFRRKKCFTRPVASNGLNSCSKMDVQANRQGPGNVLNARMLENRRPSDDVENSTVHWQMLVCVVLLCFSRECSETVSDLCCPAPADYRREHEVEPYY